MKTIFLILSVLSIIFALDIESTINFQEGGNYLGDQCLLADGLTGKCVKAKECTTIPKTTNITRCEFEKNELIVCCPNFEEIASTIDEYDDGETAIAPPSDVTRERFEQILCENQEAKGKFVPNIYKGKEADVAEFPFQVALGYRSNSTTDSYDFNCGGSLLLNDIVITAAHCVHLKDVQPVVVRLGRTSLVESSYDHGPVVDVKIKKIIIHENSRRITRQNDIALIKLDKKVEFTHYIKPICISKESDAWNKNLTVTGFGVVNPDRGQRSTWLMWGIVEEKDLEDCRKSYSEANLSKTIFDSQICASGKFGTDACQGDSGGPLILEENGKDSLYGISSHGNGCGSFLPALYTRVNYFLNWIEKTIRTLDQLDTL